MSRQSSRCSELAGVGPDRRQSHAEVGIDGIPSPTWRKLLTDHAKNIWACDFFGVRTVFFRTLYVFFVMHHETRQILQVRVTRHPTADWAAQQVVDTLWLGSGSTAVSHP